MGAFSAIVCELVSLISGFCSAAGLSSGWVPPPNPSEDEVGTTDDAGIAEEPPETEDILEDVADDGNGLVVELGSSGLISLLLGACWASLASLDSAVAVTTVFDEIFC